MCNCNPTSSTSNSSVISVGGGGCGTCQNGEDGASAYTYVAYADDVTDQCDPAYATTGFSLTPSPTTQWVGFITTTSPLTPPAEGDFECSWVQIAGSGVGPAGLISVEENFVQKVVDPNILNFIESGIVDINIVSTPVGSNTKADITIDASIFEKITLANAQALLTAGTLEPGRLYWIYDVGDAAIPANGGLNNVVTAANAYAGIIIKAVDVDKFASTGAYIARLTSKLNFWNSTDNYGVNSTVEHLNAAWKNPTTAQAVATTVPPSANLGVWQRVSKEDNAYYSKVFSCVYDVATNQIYNITDQRNNSVTLTSLDLSAPFTTPPNELFYYCFRWTEDTAVYNNKITIGNVGVFETGFFGATQYPKLAMPASNSYNSAFWSYAFYNNTISLDFGKSTTVFNASKANGAATYPSFYAGSSDEPKIHNNVIIGNAEATYSATYINHYIDMYNNVITNCEIGTITNTIISTHAIYPLGQFNNCTLISSRVFGNTGRLTTSNLRNAEILRNTDLTADKLNGYLEVRDNTRLQIDDVTCFTTGGNSASITTSRIFDNTDVYIYDVIGDRFNIEDNTNISISINVRLYNANIKRNEYAGDPSSIIYFDTDGKTPIVLSSTNFKKSCVISQVELRNFSAIEDNKWYTAGGIARCTLTSSNIQYCNIDFRDKDWIASGTLVPPYPAPPPAVKDFSVDLGSGPVDVYLFQNRKKVNNVNYPFPAIMNQTNLLANVTIDGDNGSGSSALPLRNAFIYDTGNWLYLPFISEQDTYANGTTATLQGGGLYVFLNVYDENIWDPTTSTLNIPGWAQHASILYLYDPNNNATIDISKIADNSYVDRPIHNFRIVALSYGLTVEINTTAIASTSPGSNDIVANVTPGFASIVISDKSDILEIEKRDGIYYVSNHKAMQ